MSANLMDKVLNMSNEELLDLYSDFVRNFHYNPGETSDELKELSKAGFGKDKLFELITERMNPELSRHNKMKIKF